MRKVLLFDFGTILVGLSKEQCVKALEQIGCGRIAYYVDECRQEDLFHDLEIGGSIATSIAWRIARSTRLEVVWNFLAIVGYRIFVMELSISTSSTDIMIASRRY